MFSANLFSEVAHVSYTGRFESMLKSSLRCSFFLKKMLTVKIIDQVSIGISLPGYQSGMDIVNV